MECKRLPQCVLAIALFVSPGAAAEAPDVRVQLEVDDPGGCAGETALAARVTRRSERIRFVSGGADLRRARAEVRAGDGALRATLSLWTSDGRELVRELEAKRCDDLLDALALVLAVTLDPGADLGDDSSPEPSVDERTTREPRTAAGSQAAAGTSNAPPGAASFDAGVEEPESARSGAARTRVKLLFGAAGGLRSGPAPMLLPGAGAFVGVDLEPGLGSDFARLRLSAMRHRRGDFEATGGTAEFELDAVRLEACPFGFGERLVATLCLQGELGQLEASGSATLDQRSHTRPWRSVGASGSLGWRFVPALEAGLTGALDHPLVRDRFAFAPRTFHEVPAAGFRLELALALRVP